MEYVAQFFDIVLHLDQHLTWLADNYGVLIYAVLFAIIFCATGLVITPFLPGDSLLFVAGTLAATGSMDVHGLFALLALASFLGDNTNYWTGRFVGPRIFTREQSRLLNPAHLERTRQFYDKFGPQMIIFARFLPIIRTFAPFVAGIARMLYSKFLFYSFAGCIFWIGFFVYCGYYFGNIPFVKKNLTLFILAIIFISVLPGVIGFVRQRFRRT